MNSGFEFSLFEAEEKPLFDKLLEIFQELITHTSGDYDEAMDWMRQLDKEYKLTNEDYTLDDFEEDLKKTIVVIELYLKEQGNKL